MTLYIVRHGQTKENVIRMLQGHMPGNLTELGKDQVRKTAEDLANRNIRFKCIVSSDLKRAMDSAKIIADRLNLPVVPMTMLRERDWGSYTGTPLSEARDKFYKNGKWDFPLAGHPAETEDQILQRAKMAIAKLSELYPDDNIIVVTHGQFARNMFAANANCSYKEIESFANAEVRLLQK
jgi:probable phosphoglycerate mutase